MRSAIHSDLGSTATILWRLWLSFTSGTSLVAALFTRRQEAAVSIDG